MTIPQHILDILSKIEAAGFEAFAVGGCVRDSFLGKTPSDWDITTSANPDEVIEIFSSIYTIPTGLKHGTVTVLTDSCPVEVTTYRIDGSYIDNRRPQNVTFSHNLEDDLSRRDFTINAMAYNPKIGLIDPFGGMADLAAKRIRCVGKAFDRFSEDALRMLRALRFSATLDFEIDHEAKDGIYSLSHLLHNISKERINAELCKLITAQNATEVLFEFRTVFGSIFGLGNAFEALSSDIKLLSAAPPHLIIRFAVLFNSLDSDIAGEILKNLKFDKKTVSTVKRLIVLLKNPLTPDAVYIKTILSKHNAAIFELLVSAKKVLGKEGAAVFAKIEKIYNKIRSDKECYSLKDLAVSGSDIMNEFGISGADIGNLLEFLLTSVIKGDCQNTSDSLLAFAQTYFLK